MTTRAPQATPPPAPPARFHDKFTWPMIVTAVFTFGVTLLTPPVHRGVDAAIYGCREDARQVVQAGEVAYDRGQLDQGLEIAQQALAMSKTCRCAHMLFAKIEMRQMLAASERGDTKLEREARMQCFTHAVAAADFRGMTPELDAIRQACGVAQGH